MSSLTRNVLSNVLERVVSAALTLVILPFQVRILGIEAYGVLGFVASLQVIFNILDFGLGPTVIREVAADSERRARYLPVFQSLTTVYWGVAILIGALLAGSGHWIAVRWLNAGALPTPTVVLALRLIAVSILLRWPVSLYAGAITGAQRLDLVNVIRIAVSITKLVGGIAVLVMTHSLVDYLLWLVATALLELVAYMFGAARIVSGLSLWPRFSAAPLRGIWRYSLHMNVLSILAVMFVQADRVVISRALPISELGFYSVAYTAVMVMAVLQSVVTAALFPAFVSQIAREQWTEIDQRYRIAVQLLMYVLSGCAAALVFHGRQFLSFWISSEAGLRSSAPMAILAVGFLFSGAVSIPYTLAVAAGRTKVPVAVNLAAAPAYVLIVSFAVHAYGLNGAAWAWLGLNAYYFVVMAPLILRSLPVASTWTWLLGRVVLFGGVAAATIGGSALFLSVFGGRWTEIVGIAVGVACYAAVAYFLLDRNLRCRLKDWRSLQHPIRVPAV